MHYYDTHRKMFGYFFTVNIICFGTKCDAYLGIMSCQVLFYQHLHTIKIRSKTREYRSKYICLRASRLYRSASIRVHVETANHLC